MRNLIIAWTLAVLFCPAYAVFAQDYAGQTVREIRLEGLQRVSPSIVRAQIEVEEDAPYNPQASARDLRRLHDMGYFATVRVEAAPVQNELIITYVFEEKRMIREVNIAGNDIVGDRHIRGALRWREGDSFNPGGYEQERESILELYQERGFPNAQVEIIVEEIGPAEVSLTYLIEEGPRARIGRIDFVGNETLSDSYLRDLIETSSAWWFLGGEYSEPEFEADLQRIAQEYGNHGHLEAEVLGAEFEYDEKGRRLYITVHIDEGPIYHIANLDVQGNIVFEDEEIISTLEARPNAVHNRSEVRSDVEVITQGYSDSGYVNAQVTPQVLLDRDNHTTNITHQITEDELKYVREIRITGNTITRDDVIRNRLHLDPGDRFDGSALRQTRQELERTGYFDEVRFSLEPLEGNPRYENLIIDVEEAQTGEFTFGVGFSPDDGIGGHANVELTNFDITNPYSFAGGGQQLRAEINIARRRTEFNLGFTDPEIGGLPLMFGVDVYNRSVRPRGAMRYREDSSGGQIRVGKELSPYMDTMLALRYRDLEIRDIPTFSSRQLRRERGGRTTISAVWNINRDTRDDHRNPSEGARHNFEVELAGLGGDNDFIRLEHDSTWYYSFGDRDQYVLSYRTREGYVKNYGQSDFVPLSDRFFAGGTTTIRGYRNHEVGPTERRFFIFGPVDRVGGQVRLLNNVEVQYNIFEPLRLYSFVDGGAVWAVPSDIEVDDLRFSGGVGVGFDAPMLGPVRLDYAHPINPGRYQSSSGRFHFQTGMGF